jgi:hypothetical protein
MMRPNLGDIPRDRLWSWVSGRNITLVRGVVNITRGEAEAGEAVEVVEEVAEEAVVADEANK